jgi:hypothetical protein
MAEVNLSLTFFVQDCINCGIPFAVPIEFQNCRRRDGKMFYCPNGHQMSYTETEAMKLTKQLDQARADAERQKQWRIQAEEAADKERRAKHRLQKRISAGVCPCCNRTFTDLARHMGTKHKEYALPAIKPVKLIEASKAN